MRLGVSRPVAQWLILARLISSRNTPFIDNHPECESMKIVYILTSPQMGTFLRGQIAHLIRCGAKVVLYAPELTPGLDSILRAEGGVFKKCAMERGISPLKDMGSFFSISRQLAEDRPDATVTLGPKAGLIGNLAAACAGIPVRVQMKWGLRFETASGILRQLLITTERLSALAAHRTIFDSRSARSLAIALGILPAEKAYVAHKGSANGIDVSKFAFSPELESASRSFRAELGIRENAPVIGFVGRLGRDKGLGNIVRAWPHVTKAVPGAQLVLVGPDECRDPEEQAWLESLRRTPSVHVTGPRSGIESIFRSFSMLLLPSHREGFGMVILEAAAAGIPTVAFDVTGVRDAVVDGKTGLLATLGDDISLAERCVRYLLDDQLRHSHGESAQRMAESDFKKSDLWKAYFGHLAELSWINGCGRASMHWVEPSLR
jgi:glycosyltransferase involved in cell wall biosynthesis